MDPPGELPRYMYPQLRGGRRWGGDGEAVSETCQMRAPGLRCPKAKLGDSRESPRKQHVMRPETDACDRLGPVLRLLGGPLWGACEGSRGEGRSALRKKA